MEEVQELAGHLKAELLDAKHQFEHGRITESAYMRMIEAIRGRRLLAQAAYRPAAYASTAQVSLF
jgi:hypothetical protein